MFSKIRPTQQEIAAALPGDDIVPKADVVMDRAFNLPAPPKEVWPWIIQLGKNRSGWYMTRKVEHFIPRSRRALRTINPKLQGLRIGDSIPDWGGKNATFEAAIIKAPAALVYTSTRGKTHMSWAIILRADGNGTRIHFRLRLAPVRRIWLATTGGGFVDALTIAGLANGLRERLR